MVVVLTIKDIAYVLLGPFDDLVASFCIGIRDIKFFGWAVCFN